MFCKKGGLRNFTKFTEKHLQACNFIKKETLAQVFSSEFCKISNNTFLHRTPLLAASVGNSIAIIIAIFSLTLLSLLLLLFCQKATELS